jgi:hypothetical protein
MGPLDKFTALRGVVEHEDNLINHRFTWMLLIQGLLTAAAMKSDLGVGVLWGAAAIGVANAIMFGCSVLGAVDSINDCKRKWVKVKNKLTEVEKTEVEEDFPVLSFQTKGCRNYTYVIRIISFILIPVFWIVLLASPRPEPVSNECICQDAIHELISSLNPPEPSVQPVDSNPLDASKLAPPKANEPQDEPEADSLSQMPDLEVRSGEPCGLGHPQGGIYSCGCCHRLQAGPTSLVGRFYKEKTVKKRHHIKLVHEGEYVAEVDIELIYTDERWSPYLSLDDAQKLDDTRDALRKGDLRQAAQHARVYRLTPIAL